MGRFPPFHTAAGRAVLKLVPMVEANPVEGILTNVRLGNTCYIGMLGCLQGCKLFEIIGDQRRKCEGVHFAARAVR